MAALAFLYGFCGVFAALCLAYSLTDPTAGQPSNVDALAVTGAALLWPACLVVLGVGLSLDALWQRRRYAYYGDKPWPKVKVRP